MTNTKLYKTLFVLSEEEWAQLQKWITRRNKEAHPDIVKLFDLLMKNWAAICGERKEKEWVYAKLYPGSPYNDGKMRKQTHFLSQEIDLFICEQMQENSPVPFQLKLDYFSRRANAARMEELVGEYAKFVENLPQKDIFYFEQKAKLARYKAHLSAQQNAISSHSYFEEELFFVQLVSVARQLQLHLYMFSQKTVQKGKENPASLTMLLKMVESDNSLMEQPLVRLYFYAVQMYATEERRDEFFHKLKQEFQLTATHMNYEEQASLAIAMRNYASIRAREGKAAYDQLRFELFLDHTQMGLIYSVGYIPPNTFKAIVNLGLKIGKNKEVMELVDNYQEKLHESYKDIILSYVQASKAFYEGNYGETLKLINSSYDHPFDLHWDMDNKVLAIKALYHQQEWGTLTSHLKNLTALIKRHTEIEEKTSSNLLLFIRVLTKWLANPQDPKVAVKLRKDVMAKPNCKEAEWLLSILA